MTCGMLARGRYPLLGLLHLGIYAAFVGFSKLKLQRVDRGGCCCACVFPKPGPPASDAHSEQEREAAVALNRADIALKE